mgnify:CR=1 FL=1|jgi:hypothetical protein
MKNDSTQEKRLSKRYLCDKFFTHCTIQAPEESLDLTAINFNKNGIGVFSSDFIPESDNVSLSIHYENPTLTHEFYNLPCSIVYCNQTEVGSHCGIRFNLNEVSETDKVALEAIETLLIKYDDPDNRYHLFDDE